MSLRRVAVTGLGILSPLGESTDTFWTSLREGRCAIKTLDPSPDSRPRMGARLANFVAEDHFDRQGLRDLDPFAQYLVVAGRAAVKHSGLHLNPNRTAIVSATSGGGHPTMEEGFARLHNRQSAHPLTVPRIMANAGASFLSLEFGIVGPTLTISTACSSSNHAIGMAAWMVRHGMCDVAIAGGSEAPFTLGHLRAWDAARTVSSQPCRPFDRERNGLSLGEGAAVLVLESHQAALARDATIYAELLGAGMNADAHHLMQPLPSGAATAMRLALADAGLEPEQVDYINAHGTGTQLNDATETEAIKSVFASHHGRLLVSSTKSMHGHALGAAGALEAVATILALHHGVAPPTVNYRTPDPNCDLDIVANNARTIRLRYALSNSFAFGGLNAVLAFGRHR